MYGKDHLDEIEAQRLCAEIKAAEPSVRRRAVELLARSVSGKPYECLCPGVVDGVHDFIESAESGEYICVVCGAEWGDINGASE